MVFVVWDVCVCVFVDLCVYCACVREEGGKLEEFKGGRRKKRL